MTRRSIIVLAAALAILIIVILVSQRGAERPAAELGSLVTGLSESLDDITAVTVTKAGGEVVATLARRETIWSVAERDDYPADRAKLREVLVALAEARKIEQKTSNPELYARLGVEPVTSAEANGIMVSLVGLPEPVEIIIGDAAGSDYRYARLKDAAESWLIDRDPNVPRDTGDWLSPDLIDIDGERIQAVIVSHPDGETVRVIKADREQANFDVADIPAGRELLYDSVANVMGDVLENLQLEDVERASSAAADVPVVTTELRTFDGLVLTATGVERDDSGWVSLAARFDPEQAAAFAVPAEDDGDAAEDVPDEALDADPGDAGDSPPEPARDVAREAAELNERLAGWRYKIARYKFDQMTREIEDLLKAPPADS